MSKKSRRQVVVNPKKFATYALAGAAAAVGGETVDADITVFQVDVSVRGTPPGPGSTSTSLSFGNNTATSQKVYFFHSRSNANSGLGQAGGGVFGGQTGASVAGFLNTTNSFRYVSNVSQGAPIADIPETNWIGGTTYGTLANKAGFAGSQFASAGIGFVAVRWEPDGPSNGFAYGWVRLNMDGPPINGYDVVNYAFADKGEALAVGQVPEPGSLACLAFGAVGLIAWRRRRISA